jgi:hypothetical protein
MIELRSGYVASASPSRSREEMDDLGPQVTTTEDQAYAEDRRVRRRRDRQLGFAVCGALWALSVIPLARESAEGREGAKLVAVYLVVGALSLAAAAVIRGLYVLLRKLPFWSPWVFLLAAILALTGYVVQSAGEEEVPVTAAQIHEARFE